MKLDHRTASGFSLVELLVATTLTMMIMLGVMAAYSQGNILKTHVEGAARVQGNLRAGMDRITRDLRMMGFGVPTGTEIGASRTWQPALFYASATGIAFRGEIDGGLADITCTPDASNSTCPLNKVWVDSIAYYEDLGCKGAYSKSGNTQMILVTGGDTWSRLLCTGYRTADPSLRLNVNASDVTFVGGDSQVMTMEQVYYRFTASTAPPYGVLERYVRYTYTPNSNWPPTTSTSTGEWQVVARNLLDFSIEYQDASGSTLTGNPLSSGNRDLVRQIVVLMEGYDQGTPNTAPQVMTLRTEVDVRNF